MLGRMGGGGGLSMPGGNPMGQIKGHVSQAMQAGQMAEGRVANVAGYLNPRQFG